MTLTKTLTTAAALGTFIAGAAALTTSEAQAAKPGYEKCAGVVAMGENDCAANGHSCAGQAKVDSDPNEWVYLPEGTCDKIAKGTVLPSKKS